MGNIIFVKIGIPRNISILVGKNILFL